MGIKCFLCGEYINAEAEAEDLCYLTEEYGDLINTIHKSCYNYDYREYLDRKEIIKQKDKDNIASTPKWER